MVQGLSEEAEKRTKDIISDGIKEGIEKSSHKILSIGISIALIGAGFFLAIWGIGTTIDTIFSMKGSGYLLIGIMTILIGLIYDRYR